MKYGRLILILGAIALVFAHVPDAKLGKHRTNHVDQLRFYHPLSDALITNADGDEKVRVYPEAESDTTGYGSDMTRGVSVADTFWYATNLGDGEGRRDDYDVYWDSAGVVVRLLREGVELGSVVGDTSITATTCFAADVVDNSAMADDAIDTDELVDDAVTQPKVGAGAIDSTGLAPAAVHTVHLAGDIDAPLDTLGTPTYDSLKDFIAGTVSSGFTSGGAITDSSDGTVGVAAGTGWIRASSSEIGTLYSFDWAAVEAMNLTDDALNYVYVDYNSGSPEATFTTDLSTLDHTSEFVIALVYQESDHAHISTAGQRLNNFIHDVYFHAWEHEGLHRSSGIVTSEDATEDLAINITAGVMYWALKRETTSAFDSSTDGDNETFELFYDDGGAGWTDADVHVLNSTNYDDGDGTLGTVSNNQYGNFWVYMTVDSLVYVQYGVDSYTLAEAQAAQRPATTTELQAVGVPIAKVIIKKSATAFTEVILLWESTAGASAPTNHNGLSGLQGGAADDYYHLVTSDQSVIAGIGTNEYLYGNDGGILAASDGSGGHVEIDGTNGRHIIQANTVTHPMLSGGGIASGELLISTSATAIGGRAYNTGTVDPDSGLYFYNIYNDDFAVGDNAQAFWTVAIGTTSLADRSFVLSCSTKTDTLRIQINDGGETQDSGVWNVNVDAARIRWSVIGQ